MAIVIIESIKGIVGENIDKAPENNKTKDAAPIKNE